MGKQVRAAASPVCERLTTTTTRVLSWTGFDFVADQRDPSVSTTHSGSEVNSLLEFDTTHSFESLTIDQVIDSVIEEAVNPVTVRISRKMKALFD